MPQVNYHTMDNGVSIADIVTKSQHLISTLVSFMHQHYWYSDLKAEIQSQSLLKHYISSHTKTHDWTMDS